MVNFYRSTFHKTLLMETLNNLWENITSSTVDFNLAQKALVAAVLAFIVFASTTAIGLLFIGLFQQAFGA